MRKQIFAFGAITSVTVFIFTIIRLCLSLFVFGFICYGVYCMYDQGVTQFITAVGVNIKQIAVTVINS